MASSVTTTLLEPPKLFVERNIAQITVSCQFQPFSMRGSTKAGLDVGSSLTNDCPAGRFASAFLRHEPSQVCTALGERGDGAEGRRTAAGQGFRVEQGSGLV